MIKAILKKKFHNILRSAFSATSFNAPLRNSYRF